jgi:hypothetical protein
MVFAGSIGKEPECVYGLCVGSIKKALGVFRASIKRARSSVLWVLSVPRKDNNDTLWYDK